MIEAPVTWVRPGKEETLQGRFSETIKTIKKDRAIVQPSWSRVVQGRSDVRHFGFMTNEGRNAITYLELIDEIKNAEGILNDIRGFIAATTIRSALSAVQTTDATLDKTNHGTDWESSVSVINPNKRRNLRVKVNQEPPATSELVEKVETARVYRLCRLASDNRITGSLVIQPMNGWIDKKVAEISKNSPVKAQAVVAMVDYLRGDVSERGANGRAASRHPEKKMPYLSIAIDRRRYSLWTLKPDGIPTVEIKGKELTHVRIVYTTVDDSRVILGVFSDRASYDKYCNTLG